MQHYVRHSVANASSQSVAQPPRDPGLCACNRTQNLRESAAVNLNAYGNRDEAVPFCLRGLILDISSKFPKT